MDRPDLARIAGSDRRPGVRPEILAAAESGPPQYAGTAKFPTGKAAVAFLTYREGVGAFRFTDRLSEDGRRLLWARRSVNQGPQMDAGPDRAQKVRQPSSRARLLDQTHHPWRAPGGTRWGASVLWYAYVELEVPPRATGLEAMGRKGGCAQIAPWPRPADNDRDNDRERGKSSAGEMTK